MRIAYVITTLGVGGAERQALALAERMAARGHAVSLIVLGRRVAEEWSTALPVIRLSMRKSVLSLAAALARARRTLAEFHPDLVHSHSFHANIFARMLHLFHPAPVLSTVHNVYEGGWLRMLAYRLTDGLSGGTAAVSSAVVERYVRLKAVPARKCVVMMNGIDTAAFAPYAERSQRIREAMGAAGEFIWIAAGRMAPAKDYPNLLRAFRRVMELRPAARLWIAGEPGDGAAAIRALATELGVDEAIRWLGLRRDLPALLDAADAFVLASAWEGMPLVVGEAMAMEKPVAATDVGGVRELCGACATIVSSRDADSLADAMLATMEKTQQEREELGRAARERIVRNFNMEARADAWEILYRKRISPEG